MTIENQSEFEPWQTVAKALHLEGRSSFGQLLQTWRKAEGLTQLQVAQQLGISKQLLSAYERGVQVPSLATGADLAKKLSLFLPQALQALLSDQLSQAELSDYTVTVNKVS
jgi:transcriptional regulator with XRE-family HTH domain